MNELVITALNDHKEPCTTILKDGHYELWFEDGRWIVKRIDEKNETGIVKDNFT